MNSFFKSQFNYCPLVWMCHSRLMNNKINRLHEKCLRIVYSDKTSSFEGLLAKDRSVTTHTRNLQELATEMFQFIGTCRQILQLKFFALSGIIIT